MEDKVTEGDVQAGIDFISYARTFSRRRYSNSIFVCLLYNLFVIKKIYKVRENNVRI